MVKPGSALEAFQAELLVDLVEIEQRLEKIAADAKSLAASTEAYKANVAGIYEAHREQTLQVVAFVKAKHMEVLNQAAGIAGEIRDTNEQQWGRFEKTLWVLTGVSAVTTVLSVGVLVTLAIRS